MKTSELTGAALDWAVAKCVGIPLVFKGRKWPTDGAGKRCGPFVASLCWDSYSPSTNWLHGGPIIEREKISLTPFPNYWEAQGAGVHYRDDALQTGDNPLVAAMRCYVASKLGDTIDIPEELTP